MNKMLPFFITVVLGRGRHSPAAHRRISPTTVGLFLLALLLIVRLPVAAQAPAWQSARAVAVAVAAANNNASTVTATAVDAVGNVFLAGSFTNTVVLGGTTLTSLGIHDVFVAKFNPVSNQFVWAQRAGGPSYDQATALAVSGTGIYVAGYFKSATAGFGTTALANSGVVGSTDVFVAKLTDAGSTGSFVWAQRAGGTRDDYAPALAVNGTSVYVAGDFSSPVADFGTTTLTTTGGSDAFVAKLTDAGATGSFAWAQRAGGIRDDAASAITVNGSSVYLTGTFASPTVAFGATTLSSAGYTVMFVTKLIDAGPAGSFVWAQQAGDTGDTYARALAVSGTSVYVAGQFVSPAVAFGATTLAAAGSADVFVAKLTDAGPTGSFAWTQRAGGTGYDVGVALAVRGANVYIAGIFASATADFGTITLTTSAGSSVTFAAKLIDAGSTGSFVWAQQGGGSSTYALALGSPSVYVVGDFGNPTATFGSTILLNPTFGSPLGFLASLTDPTLTATTTRHVLAPAQLYPNPARHTVTLHLPAGIGPLPLSLTDALGRAVRTFPAPAGLETVLDLHGLPAGLYLLRGAGPAPRLVME